MQWTKDKKIALWIALGFLVLTAPLWVWVASNAGAAILSMMLEREPTLTEIVGNYIYEAKWGTAALHISHDGTFTETVAEDGNTPTQYRGLWAATAEANFAKVTFRPFGMVWDDNHGSETDSFAMNFYTRRLGKTYATIDDDLGEQFNKR